MRGSPLATPLFDQSWQSWRDPFRLIRKQVVESLELDLALRSWGQEWEETLVWKKEVQRQVAPRRQDLLCRHYKYKEEKGWRFHQNP